MTSGLTRITFAEKRRFSDVIATLTPGQIGKVVALLEERAPAALKNVDSENVQVIVDFIPKRVYDDVIE